MIHQLHTYNNNNVCNLFLQEFKKINIHLILLEFASIVLILFE